MIHKCKACSKEYDTDKVRIHDTTVFPFAKCPYCDATNPLPELRNKVNFNKQNKQHYESESRICSSRQTKETCEPL